MTELVLYHPGIDEIAFYCDGWFESFWIWGFRGQIESAQPLALVKRNGWVVIGEL